MQRADEQRDLLHHHQVLLQVLQLLEEARWAQVHLVWQRRDLTQPQAREGVHKQPSVCLQ